MKRLLSSILSLLLALAVFAPCYTVINNRIERNNVSRFCSAVSQLNKKYKSVESQIIYDENGDKNFNLTENRLIIKTKDKIKNTKAINEVYGLDYAVLQYENKGDMLDDYDNLQSRGYTVEKDRIYFLTDFDNYETKSDITVMASSASSNYGYVNSGAIYAKEVFQNNIDSYDEIVVGIMDTGIDYTHEIFENRYVENRVNFSGEGDPDDPMDENLHGTAVASIVVQSTPDNVKVKPYKIIGESGSATNTEIISALEYILSEKDKPDVMNMSFGGYNFDGSDKIMNDLVEELVECGITVCVAAGNEGVPAEYAHPANCPSVITASSHGSTSYISDYSDYGKAVDISAPGEKIYTAKLGGGYTSEHSGTSFSAPFVSAACACVLMKNPDMTPAEVKEKIKRSAVSVGEDDSYYFGSGMLSFVNLIDDKPYDVPVPSVSGGLYHNEQTISFDVPDGVDLVYTTDRSIPTASSSLRTKAYTEPITVSSDTLLIYALVKDGKYVSNIASREYIIQYYVDESDFTIDSGVITACKTDKTNIVVPDTIDGVAPTSVASGAFEKSTLQSVVLPDSITTLEGSCFKNFTKLKHIVSKGVTTFSGTSVFSGCTDLRDEVMPNLKTVTENAFENCTKLHEIDFGENITELKSSLFSGAGLLYGNFPNANATVSDESIFMDCTLFTCNIPNLNTLYKKMFEKCKYLYDLKTDAINTIHSEAIKSCYYLDLDTTNVNTLYSNALSGCRMDTFYAPGVTEITPYSSTGSTAIGTYVNTRVLDLPSLTTPLKSKAISYSYIQELYLDSVTQMTVNGALHNIPYLNIVYMPNVEQFYYPTASLSYIENMLYDIFKVYLQKPPLKIVWIPRAEVMSTVTLTGTKLFFAPGTSSLTAKITNDNTQASIVVSEKVSDGQLTITNSGKSPVVIAPEGSYAQQYASDENCGYTFISADDCIYNGTDEKSNMLYTAGENNFSVPLDFVTPCWNIDSINKTRTESFYEFLLDFTNDKIINVKDFSILQKEIRNQQVNLS